jgi:hypothetical protein
LKVTSQKKRWIEKGERKLKWMSRAKAAITVKDTVLGGIIRSMPKNRQQSKFK